MEIGLFSREHAQEALRLSTQVGWNHIEQDWLRTIELNPAGCVGGFIDGQLIATTTLSQFGDLGWVGTFLVDKDHQRRGLGSLMFDALMKRATALGIQWLALDSSEVGRPIYRRFGFIEDEGIERWTGPALLPVAPPSKDSSPDAAPDQTAASACLFAEPLTNAVWDRLLEFDRAQVNIDRRRQLMQLAGEPGAAGRLVCDRGEVTAFGLSRPGRLAGTIGPVVARDIESARRIVTALRADRARLDGADRGIAIDLLDHDEFKQWMTSCGFVCRRRNIRMFHPARLRPVLTGPAVFAATSLGMG